MKYNKFCCYKPNISSLTKMEIESPYLVLEELYTKRTLEDFKDELWAFQRTILKDSEWKNFDPADIYAICYDLIRLTDALWLVNKYNSKLSSPLNNTVDSGSDSRLMDDLNNLFAGSKSKDPNEDDNSTETVLSYFFANHYNGFSKSDMYCYLQLGLDASYMQNDKYDYFNLADHQLASDFFNLSELIEEGYKIYQYGTHMLPVIQSPKEIKFAIDYDRPTHLTYECLEKPIDIAKNFFNYYLDINHIHTGLNAWKALFYEKDFWKKADNPGNLIRLEECLVKLIELIWLTNKKNDLESYISIYKATKGAVAIAQNCSQEEQTNPMLAIQGFFAFKEMYKWKALLHKWLMYSLSNSGKKAVKNRHKTELAFRHLLKFIEASYLLLEAPENLLNEVTKNLLPDIPENLLPDIPEKNEDAICLN